MAQIEEVKGIVLYQRKHRERDFLVKIFTRRFGKIMFFVKGSKRQQGEIYQAIQSFTQATFIADIRESGLSFLRAAKDIERHYDLERDIFKNAYATYIAGLIDAVIEDYQINDSLFRLLEKSLFLINEGYEAEVIANIVEVKLLKNFGVKPNFLACAVCGKTEGTFDYSDKYHGVLCSKHFSKDPRRLHISPRAVHLVRLYSVIQLEKIGEISISKDTQNQIKELIDHIYDELVGLHLKSKSFIDNLYKWEGYLRN
ncbi:MAG: DNA repair protein RecO, partial [Atopostipes suicloacalis]|nr:DNA repair protein RecO [Atopostipes suicloacalis]